MVNVMIPRCHDKLIKERMRDAYVKVRPIVLNHGKEE